MLQTAIILAGGYGTRLQSVVSDVPKPMALVNEEPFLKYQFRYLKYYGIQRVILSIGYLAEKIQSYFENNYQGIRIEYVIEKEALGTGGGIRLAMENAMDNDVLVLNGDSFFDVDLGEFYKQHRKTASQISLALRMVENASRYGVIDVDRSHRIIRFNEKSNEHHSGIINGGIYILNKTVFLKNTPENKSFSIERDFFETKSKQIHMNGFIHGGYFIDIGIPEDYQKVQHDFKGFKY